MSFWIHSFCLKDFYRLLKGKSVMFDVESQIVDLPIYVSVVVDIMVTEGSKE